MKVIGTIITNKKDNIENFNYSSYNVISWTTYSAYKRTDIKTDIPVLPNWLLSFSSCRLDCLHNSKIDG